MKKSINEKFASHINDTKLIAEMKGKGENAYVQKISLRPVWRGKRCGIHAKIGVTAVNITPLNKSYIHEGVTLQTVLGNKSVYKKGAQSMVVVDISAISNIDRDMLNAAEYMVREFYLSEMDGRTHVLLDISDEDAPCTTFADISGKADEYGNLPIYGKESVFTEKGNFKRSTRRFSGEEGCVIFSSSQGRKKQFTAYENTSAAKVKKYFEALKKANLDEYNLTKKLVGESNPKGIADSNTRLSSKTTAMNLTKKEGCAVSTYAVLFNTDVNSDGRFVWSADCIAENILAVRGTNREEYGEEKFSELAARCVGHLIQSRPYTVKAAGLVMDQMVVDAELGNFNLFRIDVASKESKKVLDAVNTVLNKEMRSRAGIRKVESSIPGVSHKLVNLPEELQDYDGVVICHNGIDAPVQMAGNLDAFKDHYDLRETDGCNILAVAHMDENDFICAATSAQMNKVLLRAVRSMPELTEDLNQTMAGIIKRGIDNAVSFDVNPRRLGAEMIDTSFVPDVVRQLNPGNVAAFPSVLRGMIDDAKSRVENMINFDAYPCAGHFGMITSDICYNVWGRSVLNVTKNYVEVYDPVFNRYAELHGIASRHGVAIKYPAMGTREILFVVYISEEEMARRTQELGAELGKTQEQIDIIVGTYQTLKEGAVMLPADLELIAWIAAGSDLDGDKAGFFFEDPEGLDIVHILWRAMEAGKFSWRAVRIGNNGRTMDCIIKCDQNSFQRLGYLQVNVGNYDVGAVTNAFRILAEGLLIHDSDTVGVKFFMHLFHKVFGMGSIAHGDYVSPIRVDRNLREGFDVCCTDFEVVQQMVDTIARMAPTWENVKLALDDFDVVGRHVQELTIDAQKKFYEVHCDFIEELRKAFSISQLKVGIQFDMNWATGADDAHVALVTTQGYAMDSHGVVSFERSFRIEKPSGGSINVLADAFAPFRVYAATYAIKKLDAARKEYFAKVNDEKLKAARERAYSNLLMRMPAASQVRLAHAIHVARNANTIYKHHIRAMEKEYLSIDMNRADACEVREDIRRDARTKYHDMLDNVSNEIRCIAEECGVKAKELVLFAAESKDVVSGLIGRILKEETCYYLAAKSEISEVKYDLYGKHAAAVTNNDFVHVVNGEVIETGTRVNLMDGEYVVREDKEAGTVSLVRPLTDYVEVPKADHNRVTFGLRVSDIHALDTISGGDRISLRHMKDEHGRDVVMLCDAEGKFAAPVYCGNFSRKNMVGKQSSFSIISPRFADKEGTVAAIDVSMMEKDGKGNSYCYAVITIKDVSELEVVPVSIVDIEEADPMKAFR